MSFINVNPFLDPRAADSLNGKDYVRCFSPYLVEHLPEVFAQGNVILKGTIGCGKSMILRLFDPKVRIAYHEKNAEFPVPEYLRKFIGTGINLSKSGILDILQRMPRDASHQELKKLTAIFADYLNYWLVDDLINSCCEMINHVECFPDLIDPSKIDVFVKQLRQQDCWFGYLLDCNTLEDIHKRINERINCLRSWANWNTTSLDPSIDQSKTAISEPVAVTVTCLKDSGVLNSETCAFVRIDQMEELIHKDPPHARVTESFRSCIYSALGRRDGRVSYRIGTRKYDDDVTLTMPGGRLLEESRDYIIQDFDLILRRGENRKSWLFKGFAEDVFNRRLEAVFPLESLPKTTKQSLFRHFFGPSPTPRKLIERIIVNQDTPVESLFDLSKLPKPWQAYIHEVYLCKTALSANTSTNYKIDPLNACLVYAWALQNGGKAHLPPRCETEDPPSVESKAPWTVWWQKERVRQAVLQLASKHNQRLLWWGENDILALSSTNITLFLSLCRETWELWQRHLRTGNAPPEFDNVPPQVQQVAIDNVSKRWHQNLAKQPGRPSGDVRIRFLDRVFADLQIRLRKDIAMRYPGANGFSVIVDDIAEHLELKQLIDECVAWGDLEKIHHTSKHGRDKTRGERFKFYANSILVPHYQLFEAHTKEPRYMKPDELLKHALNAKALTKQQKKKGSEMNHPEFDWGS